MSGSPRGDTALKRRLEAILSQTPSAERAALDPVSFPRRFFVAGRPRPEIELMGLLAAMMAYGKLELFTRVTADIVSKARERLLDVALNKRALLGDWPGYRLSTGPEIARLVHAGGTVIAARGGLWESFKAGWQASSSLKDGLIALHTDLVTAARKDGNGPMTRGLAHLLPDPAKGGAVKRWMMFTRWMVRPDDGVDLGLWPEVPPSALLMPLDRHISMISRHLGFTSRASDDWKTAEEITAALRRFSPADPVRYDFALCHLGISGRCTHGRNSEICAACELRSLCTAGRKRRKRG